MEQEIHFTGYATEPSDYECPDGGLSESLNLLSEDGQLKPRFQPAVRYKLPADVSVIFVHKTAAYTHYIARKDETLYWFAEGAGDAEGGIEEDELTAFKTFDERTLYQVTAMGNTLIVLLSDGVDYILWKDNAYKDLGQKPPETSISFSLNSELVAYPGYKEDGDGKVLAPMTLRHTVNEDDVPIPSYATTSPWLPPRPIIIQAGKEFTDFDFSLENKTGDEGTSAVEREVERITAFALAGVNKLIATEGTEKERFIFPFFVRYAYELYDGSLIMHSYPVLLIPNSRGPIFAMNGVTSSGYAGFELDNQDDGKVKYTFRGRVYCFASSLYYKLSCPGLDDWKDIIRAVNVYVTPQQYTYDQAGKVYGWKNMDADTDGDGKAERDAWSSYYTVGTIVGADTRLGADVAGARGKHLLADVFPALTHVDGDVLETTTTVETDEEGNVTSTTTTTKIVRSLFVRYSDDYPLPSYLLTIPEKTETEIRDGMTSESRYYKLYSFKIDDLCDAVDKDGTLGIKEGTLASLAARQTMTDDYHTRDVLTSQHAFPYNARLNLGGVTRRYHAPLSPAVAWPLTAGGELYQVAVHIKDEDGASWLVSAEADDLAQELPKYLFYPDTHATELVITDGSTIYTVPLTEHPTLTGAYWMGNLWSDDTLTELKAFPTATGGTIDESAKVYTSAANNPFFFPATGINTVGTGCILGLSSAVKALSQGQFGQFPLYAFTTDGVWALEVDTSTGAYSAKQPVTRDVCTAADGITQLDDTVLFPTARGIMMLQGSAARCLTDTIYAEAPFNVLDLPAMDKLHGKLGALHDEADACLPVKPFLSFLDGCRMVYDYVHQRVVVFNPATGDDDNPLYRYAYVYSLRSKEWGMMYSRLLAPVNDYPNALAMTQDGELVSFAATDEPTCRALYVTRPLKLGAPDVLKTVTTLIQRGHFQRGDVATVLYGSRDLYNWRLVWSSTDHYLRGQRGTPYKYFRLAGLATLTDGKSLFSASVQFNPRQTNNMR